MGNAWFDFIVVISIISSNNVQRVMNEKDINRYSEDT